MVQYALFYISLFTVHHIHHLWSSLSLELFCGLLLWVYLLENNQNCFQCLWLWRKWKHFTSPLILVPYMLPCAVLLLQVFFLLFTCDGFNFMFGCVKLCQTFVFRQSMNKNQMVVSNHKSIKSLLEKTCDLIRNFPEYHNVVVSVARKTDGRHWAELFSAAGRSTE